jgi:hypothetical protein
MTSQHLLISKHYDGTITSIKDSAQAVPCRLADCSRAVRATACLVRSGQRMDREIDPALATRRDFAACRCNLFRIDGIAGAADKEDSSLMEKLVYPACRIAPGFIYGTAGRQAVAIFR